MFVNRGELAKILAVGEPVIDRMRARGLPGKKKGHAVTSPWEYDTKAVIEWMIKDATKDSTAGKKQGVDLRISLADAELKEFKVAEMRGTMLHIDDITPIVEEQFVVIKSKINALPGRLAQKCAVESDAATVLRLIKEEVAEVLDGISNTKLRDPDRKKRGFQPPDDKPGEEVAEDEEDAKPWEDDGL